MSFFRSWSILLLGAMLCAALAGCAGRRATSSPGAAVSGSEPTEDQLQQIAEAHAHYAAAVAHDLNGRPEAARQEFFLAAKKDITSESLVLEVSRRLLQAKQSDKALDLLTRAAEVPGASASIYSWLGIAFFQAGKTNQAIAANRTAISKSPGSLPGYQNLFIIHTQAHQEDQAFNVLEEAYHQTGSSPEFLVGLADLYINHAIQVPKQRKAAHDRALALLKAAAALKPTQTVLQLKIAETMTALGETEAAARVWHQVLKTAPDVPALKEQVHARLAEIYLRSSNKERATEQLEAIIREDPTNPIAYYFLGSLALEAQKLESAADHFSKTLILSPNFEPAYYDLATAQIGLSKPSEALTTLGKARELFGQTFLLELFSALAFVQEKAYTEALQHFTTAEIIARATDPKRLNHAFYFQFGAAYERQGDYAQAETCFRKCLELNPEFPEAQNYLGYMWAERGTNLHEARKLIEQAVSAQPTNAAYLDSLGWVFFKLGDLPQALEQIQKSVSLLEEPDPTVYDHLGDVLQAMQEPEKAREAWKKSLELEPNEAIQKKIDGQPPVTTTEPSNRKAPS